MRAFTERALDTAQSLGADYADVRIEHKQVQHITVKNGRVEALSETEERGFGIRVLHGGSWGFASSAGLEAAEIDRVAALALEIAKASALTLRERVDLGQPVKAVGSYRTPVEVDPFTVSLDEKIRLLLEADRAMRSVRGVSVAESAFEAQRIEKTFASTEGSYVEQVLVETGGGIEALAVGEHDAQRRSYPNSFGRHQATAGFEFVVGLDLVENGALIAEQAVQLLTAEQCPSQTTTLVLDPTQMALQVHESCGHPIELDRVFGTEAAYAGTSFLTLDKLGSFQYGSEHVTIAADATVARGLGTFGWDDEGVPAQRTVIVRNGTFESYLTSRETAARLGRFSNGTMRADGWNRIPLIRMTNVNLEPGPWRPEDLIADTDDGIFMQTNRSWSIDDLRLNFQFGTEVAWQIKDGKLGKMYKNATYTGITPQFWRSCDAVCQDWRLWGVVNCGKGQPPQAAHVGHGAATARFRDVQVGIA